MGITKAKKVFAKIVIVSVAILCCFILISQLAVAANIDTRAENIRVFVGGSRLNFPPLSALYRSERTKLLNDLAEGVDGGIKTPESRMSALVILDDYYSVDDLKEIAEHITVERIYLWAPGETGRASLWVESGNIAEAIQRSYDECKNAEPFSQGERDYMNMIDSGNYGIFCMAVSGTADQLSALNRLSIVEFTDLMYSPDAEAKAARDGVSVSYIELPYKPDGAL
jgi:hypothetical protein